MITLATDTVDDTISGVGSSRRGCGRSWSPRTSPVSAYRPGQVSGRILGGVDYLPTHGRIGTVSLNIKNERTVTLIRELAQRTGESQTAAVENAVRLRLAELARHRAADSSDEKRARAAQLLRELHGSLTDEDRAAVAQAQAQMYDDNGLPA